MPYAEALQLRIATSFVAGAPHTASIFSLSRCGALWTAEHIFLVRSDEGVATMTAAVEFQGLGKAAAFTCGSMKWLPCPNAIVPSYPLCQDASVVAKQV